MGTCPSTPVSLNSLGCGSLGEFQLPKRSGCHDCFAGDLLEAHEDSSNPIKMHASSGKVLSPPIARSLSHGSQDPDSYYKAALHSNPDFNRELTKLTPEAARERRERIVHDWRAKLRVGIAISTGRQSVIYSYDPALQCLDARRHGTLYPVAALHECAHLTRVSQGAPYELRVEFNDCEALRFRFEKDFDRASFALTLHSLALEARKDKWHEDWDADGWEEETDASDDVSTAEPEDEVCGHREASSSGSNDTRDPHLLEKKVVPLL